MGRTAEEPKSTMLLTGFAQVHLFFDKENAMVEFNRYGIKLPDDPELAHLPGTISEPTHPDPELAHLPGRVLSETEQDAREREVPSHIVDQIFRDGRGRYPDDR